MRTIYFYIATGFIVLLLSASCKRQIIIEKQFPSVQELKAHTIKINEILKFRTIHKLQDYVVLYDGRENVERFFYVYSYPGFKFLYSFGEKGNGPGEYLMPDPFKNTPGNCFSFRDHGKDIFATYLLTDTGGIMTYTGDLKPTNHDRFLMEINQVGDSLFLLKRQSPKWSRRELWNLYTKEIVDSIPNTFDLEKTMGKDYYTTFEDFLITSKNDRFALGYRFMDYLETGLIKNNTMIIEKSIGTKEPPEFYLYGQMGGRYLVKFLSNVMYYESITCGEKYIYALYANGPMGEIAFTHSSLIEIYSWEGEPVTILKLNKSLSDFFVDENIRTIYGINLEQSEDHIFEYKYED
jgi:hypothetical protein